MGSRSNTLVPHSSSPLKQSSDSGLGGVAFDYSAMPKLVAVHSLSVEDNPLAEEDISGHSEVKSETHSLLPVASNEKMAKVCTLPVKVRLSMKESQISVKLKPLSTFKPQGKVKKRKVKERKTQRNGTPDPGAIKWKRGRPPETDKPKSMPLNVLSCSESSQILQQHPNQLEEQTEQEVKRISDSKQEHVGQLWSTTKKALGYQSILAEVLNGPDVIKETSSTNHPGNIDYVVKAKNDWSSIDYITLHESGESPIMDIETPSVHENSLADNFGALCHDASTNLQKPTQVDIGKQQGFSTICNTLPSVTGLDKGISTSVTTSLPVTSLDKGISTIGDTSLPVTGKGKGISTSVAISQILNKTYSSSPCSIPSLFVAPPKSCYGKVASRNPVQMEDITQDNESHVHTNEPTKNSIKSQPAGKSHENTGRNPVEHVGTMQRNRRKACTPRKLVRLASASNDLPSFQEERSHSSVQSADSALTPHHDGNHSAICGKDGRVVPTCLDFNTSELHRMPVMYERADPYLLSKGEDRLTKPRPEEVCNTASGMLWDSPPVLKTESEVVTTYDHNPLVLRDEKIQELLYKQEKLLQKIRQK